MTLTEAAYWTKRLSLVVVFLLVVSIGGLYLYLNWPTRQTIPNFEKANYACTPTRDEFIKHTLSIPSLELKEGSQLEFGVETLTGRIENLPRIVNVYRYDNPGETLSSKEEAQIIAENLGFDPDAMTRKGTSAYYWQDSETARELTVQARNLTFTLNTDFTNEKAFPENIRELPTTEEATRQAVSILQSTGLLTSDYASGQPAAVLIKIRNDGSFTMARSKAEADLIRIDFFRTIPLLEVQDNQPNYSKILTQLQEFDVENETVTTSEGQVEIYKFITDIYTLPPQKSYISVYIGPDDNRKPAAREIYSIDYTNWVVSNESCGTYELLSANEAVAKLQNGEGSLVYLTEKNGDDVIDYTPKKVTQFSILSVTLGYYNSPEESTFLQPIYVIFGEATFESGILGRFYYYVPAINYDKVTDRVQEQKPVIETPDDEFSPTGRFL
ncbi:hypothetical protein GF357_04425 [Candidatus Dojkabacteria bacterium]|nr:hypothetical protein [Candidatus Dojkabacteria bacterium]